MKKILVIMLVLVLAVGLFTGISFAGKREAAASRSVDAESIPGEAESSPEETAAQAAPSQEAGTEEYVEEEIFAEWNEGAPALDALVDYVEAVTDESSPDYIPPADRIAVVNDRHIEEMGSREELLRLDGAYAALERAQGLT